MYFSFLAGVFMIIVVLTRKSRGLVGKLRDESPIEGMKLGEGWQRQKGGGSKWTWLFVIWCGQMSFTLVIPTFTVLSLTRSLLLMFSIFNQ